MIQRNRSPASPSRPARGGRRRIWGIVVLLLSLLIFIGVVAYLIASSVGIRVPIVGNISQPPVTTVPVQVTVPYAGVDMTVIDAQQAQSFIDDPHTQTNGMVRIHLQAANKTTVPIHLLYNVSVTLVLPGEKIAAPSYVKSDATLDPGITQVNTLDFAAPGNVKLSVLLLRFGTADEAQIEVPLIAHPDVSQYEPRTKALQNKLQYFGLDWTVISVTTQLSIAGQEASKGMHYVVVTLNVNNTLSQTAVSGSAFDYAHLKLGDMTTTPKLTTLPVSFAAGAKDQTGTITFLAPQNATTATFILSQGESGFDQAPTKFQLA